MKLISSQELELLSHLVQDTALFNTEIRNSFFKILKTEKNKLILNKDKILNKCISLGYMERKEKNKFSQKYLIEYIYLLSEYKKIRKNLSRNEPQKIFFVTNSIHILNRKKELNKKFKQIAICTPLEIKNFMQNQFLTNIDKNNVDYIG